ncbi:sigma-54 dependent transcriptional regulator [Anoxynatronum sibiricum]|uniref:Stage 0 sporulation protein A homolog n=1 Tax=Anoxynatronum sibiricum TaxID=210623 RepID=A0ABU9VW58_9CLOT
MSLRILVIDDEETIRLSLQEGLMDMGFETASADNGHTGLEVLGTFKPHIVLLDMRLPDTNGLDLIRHIKEMDSDIEVVMMTAYGDIKTAVSAIKNGAFDYLHKPFELDEVQVILGRIGESLKLRKRLYLLEQQKKNADSQKMLGNHESMQAVFEKIRILAENDSVTVLIRGETGTGKELVAAAIHEGSRRREAPLVSINCGAISPMLIESELFGHEKNAFTGASARKKGLLEVADGGTVFLDEVGELHLDTQAKLLRVLEERKFKRVGGLTDIQVDIRIMAATNKNLEEAIRKREFREDLFYRLNVVPVELPPLRQRGEDVLHIAAFFLSLFNRKFGRRIDGFTPVARQLMLDYTWPGNIRELKNVMERMVILHQGREIDVADLPREINSSGQGATASQGGEGLVIPPAFSLEEHLGEQERRFLAKALEISGQNHSKAADTLGISRFSLKRKMDKHGIS